MNPVGLPIVDLLFHVCDPLQMTLQLLQLPLDARQRRLRVIRFERRHHRIFAAQTRWLPLPAALRSTRR